MGNVCSSGQKKKKDSLSEKSDDSPAYQPNVKKETHTSDEKLISCSDPAQIIAQNTSDQCKISGHKSNIEKISQEIEKTCANDSNPSTPQTIAAPSEVSSKQKVPNHLGILHGKLPKNRKVERDKKIVIYILTDNSDENKNLKDVIHSLHNQFEKKCQTKEFEFIISDVHECQNVENNEQPKSLDIKQWTESPLEAKGGHEEAANCLAEISRHLSNAYIIPVLLLGSSLETPMLPLTIESQDFKSVLKLASEEDKRLLEKWYKMDDSYQPACHRLLTDYSTIKSEESRTSLQDLFNALLMLFSEDLKDSYMTTVVEQEINNTVLMSQELAKRCIWIHSGIQCLKTHDDASPLEIEVCRRLTKVYAELKAHLSEKNLVRILPSMNILDEDLASVIESLLDRSITSIFDEHANKNSIPNNTNGIVKNLLEEIQLASYYSSILAQNASNFYIMDDVKRYIENASEFPLIVTGSPGMGKSVLVSKIVENIFIWDPEISIIVRYFNLSDTSSDITSLLGSIANQLSVIVNGSQCRTEHSVCGYTNIIKKLLESSNINVVIIIDSINEVLNCNNFDWLPEKLKATTKIILTLTEIEESNGNAMNELLGRGIPCTNFIKLKHFTNKQWSDTLYSGGGDFYVPNGALHLPEEWKILNGKTPFHAKALWWLAWLGHTSIESSNISDILEKMIFTLESKFKPKDIELLLLIISLCSWGIKENDCLAIFRGESQVEAQASFRIWSKFCWIMGPMLLYLNNVRIADKIFRDAILNRFKSKTKLVHNLISDYFQNQPNTFTSSNGLTSTCNRQKFLKLPYHYLCALDDTSIAKNSQTFYNSRFFTDLEWIFNKVISAGCLSLLYDIIFAENYFKSDCESFSHILILSHFLRNYVYELNYDGRQFLTLFKFFLKSKTNDEDCTNNHIIITDWLSNIDKYKSTYLEILNPIIKDPEIDNGFRGYDAVVYLPDNDFFVASLSTEKEEICIWDVQKCERVRELRGIPQPTAMCPVGTFEAAVLCKREIRVINLDEGKFKVKLKGVMNQKMPYFGLHDEKHLVCLSRNRMYVNLMNLESGDCVTTFKAGEDRFLNSLLVSGDGRILVCGDETQKPFPLLVWHLSQRKLLYDLRIPHHDFMTSLSAITYEGSYVCVVAKELNEPTPNFIVVYDLQSGTLFKKWKPTYNTVSLAISQINACVIAGLEDAKILIWDLITGNCRSTLVGHNAPVTFLKLDPLGKLLLSRDEEGRDYSIRLWELSTGTSLAVYTPPSQISTCEILPNGSFVVLALKNHATILTLALRNYCEVPSQATNFYGNEENQHKIFDLN